MRQSRGKQVFRVLSTFTGIGGFELGILNAADTVGKFDVDFIGYSEIDKYAVSVYQRHFNGVDNYGDITKIDADSLPDFDCLVGGFPCQAFSIAGKRGGFDDTRGTLFFDLARILRAKQPRLFVFENVKGLLNHDSGRTFRVIIAAIDELGYDCQWQVLNSKNFGVPQNRERVVIVGHLRGTPRPQVFPFRDDYPETSNPDTGKGQLVDLTFRQPYGYRVRKDDRAGTLDANYYKGIANQERPGVMVGTLRTHKDGEGFREMKSGVAPTLPARARNDGSGQPIIYVPEATKKGYAEATVGDSINLSQINSKTRRGRVGKGIANTIDTGMQQYTVQPVITPDRINKNQNGRRAKDDGDPAFAVTATDRHGVMLNGAYIRRLTPRECERLQAFPDDWTIEGVGMCQGKLCDSGKYDACLGHFVPMSDTQRYKMCGNAVTTNVVQAVFECIFRSI